MLDNNDYYIYPLIFLRNFIEPLPGLPDGMEELLPWELTRKLPDIIMLMMKDLNDEYTITAGVAIHHSAIVDRNSVIKGPAIISEDCFVGMNVLLRDGIFLGSGSRIGPGCEIKMSLIGNHTSIAHFNFIGDSLIGHHVNFEAGAIIANHFNERENKMISVMLDGQPIETGVTKFGALVGDDCKIGANAQ